VLHPPNTRKPKYPAFIAGRIPALNELRFQEYLTQYVMEITLGWYNADTSTTLWSRWLATQSKNAVFAFTHHCEFLNILTFTRESTFKKKRESEDRNSSPWDEAFTTWWTTKKQKRSDGKPQACLVKSSKWIKASSPRSRKFSPIVQPSCMALGKGIAAGIKKHQPLALWCNSLHAASSSLRKRWLIVRCFLTNATYTHLCHCLFCAIMGGR